MKMMKKVLSLLLCSTMIVGILPVGTFAAETESSQLIESTSTETTGEAIVDEESSETLETQESVVIEELSEVTQESSASQESESEAAIMAVNEEIDDLADDTTVVIAASDFQNEEGHDAGAETVKELLNSIQKDYSTADGFLFAGDYDASYYDSAKGKAKLQAAVQSVYETLSSDSMIWVQGNHDYDSLVGTTLTKSGENDAAEYGVYVINEKDYMWKNDNENTIKNTANALDTYLNAKIAEEYENPIFVISHLPLHYSMRTLKDGGDGKHANYIFNELNEAGSKGLNIIFLYGHDHSHGWDDYLGGAAVYLEVGDSINIAQNSTTSYKVETLNFTYMNAGFVGYYGDTGNNSDQTLTMTTFEITDTEVIVNRYDANGKHNLKAAGVYGGEYPDNKYAKPVYDVDTTVYESAQTITLQKFDEPVIPETVVVEDTQITVEGVTGLAGGTLQNADKALLDAKEYENYVAYDLTATIINEKASVSIPVPAEWDISRLVGISVENGVVKEINGTYSEGVYTFEVSHFSAKGVALMAEGEESIKWVEIPGSSTTYYELATSITSDNNYLIASGKSGTVKILNSNGNTTSAVVSNNVINTAVDNNYVWKISSSNSGYTIQNTSNNRYLYPNAGRFLGWHYDLETSGNSATEVSISNNNGALIISRKISSSGYTTTSYVNNSFGASGSEGDPVYIFEQKTISSASTYAGMNGKTSYNLATNAYANQAAVEAMIRDNIKVYTADDMNGTNQKEVKNYTFSDNVDPTKAGTYTLTVSYGSETLGTINVVVVDKVATSIEVNPMIGEVERGSGASANTGSTITVKYGDGTEDTVDMTVGMITAGNFNLKENGTYTDLTVSYAGKEVTGYTLKVINISGNDFPAYPEAGSIDVNKTASGLDFQNTGVARVELSTSGLPASKGADVVVVIDTSSSMDKDLDGNNPSWNEKSRIDVLSESLEDMLTQFKTANATTGIVPDIDIAIIDFNGYYPSTKGDFDKISLNNTSRSNIDYAKVFTGNNANKYIKNITLSASDFVEATSLTPSTVAGYFNEDTTQSGTNYDGALENAYKLLQAKKASNVEEREQYVIFLSDGAPFRYNGFNNGDESNTYKAWNNWLQGIYSTDEEVKAAITYNTYDKYSHFYNGDGTYHYHRYAEAIKGNEGNFYKVVSRTDEDLIEVQGLGATIYSIGFGLANDGDVVVATQQELIEIISSGEGYSYPNVRSATALTDAFTQIVTAINFAATDAYFEDQMGDGFDLQMNPKVETNANGSGTTDVDTTITVTTKPIYTKSEIGTTIGNHKVTSDDVGKAYGSGTVVETVSFTADENGNITATSTAKTEADGNILNNGIICAKNFYYNTTSADVTVDGITIPAETFYWNIGTINEKQFTLSYSVYLTGSMEGDVKEGSYDTNNYATLSYTNYLGNDVEQSVSSPSMAWGGANVSYAFYLVNNNGEFVDANGNVVPSILTAYKVTQPVLYKTINLNSGETVLSTVGEDVLPEGYTLYDKGAVYTVNVASGSGSSNWVISGDQPTSTYVTGYAGAQDYSNKTPVNDASYDYTHTTVYFAVVWTIGTVPDTVVVDYGLPVDISVLNNDMFGSKGTLIGVGSVDNKPVDNKPGAHSTTDSTHYGNAYGSEHGTAVLNNGKVRYTPNDMEMNTTDNFVYEVQYAASTGSQYYYGDVTVIPATTIYYEDDFVTFNRYNTANEIEGSWEVAGNKVSGATQAEDRPGGYSLPAIDANNVYGNDGNYASFSEYSLGSARKVWVDANSYATAEFSFYGTGFDVISYTSNQTGMLAVKVKDSEGKVAYNTIVDTYYGYSLVDGEWVKEDNAPNALYQVPVLKVGNLKYDHYDVVITATYNSYFDHTSAAGYDLYLDAIRIYNPTGNLDEKANDAYVQDGEGWPYYIELRNNIIKAANYKVTENADGTVTVTGSNLTGAIFIDSNDANTDITDYVNYGPNNELYLAPGQAIAFKLDQTNANLIADVQIALKIGNGDSVTYKAYDSTKMTAADVSAKTLTTATDMYYSIKDLADGTVVVTNTGENGILSITNIKVTYTQNVSASDEGIMPTSLFMDEEGAGFAVMSLRAMPVEEPMPEESKPEEEESKPEISEPEEESKPETSEPEDEDSEESRPENDWVNKISQSVKTVINKISNALNKLLGRWFR